jgi:hypothetical protein
LELGLGGVLAQRPHDGAQLLGRDGAIAVLVEEREGLLELGDLFLGQLIGLEQVSMLRSLFSAFFNHFRRKNWRFSCDTMLRANLAT